MGYAKELALEEQERGYRCLGDRHACLACIGDADLVRQLSDSLISARCDFCGSFDAGSAAAVVDDLIDAIAAAIESEYGHPIDELPWDEGEYLGDKLDTDDLLFGESCDIQSAELRSEIINAFLDQEWCRKN